MTINQVNLCTPDVSTPTANNIPMLGQFPLPYQSIGVGMLKDYTLIRVFPSTHPSTDVETINMISATNHSPRRKEIVESSSFDPHEALYGVIQSIYHDHSH